MAGNGIINSNNKIYPPGNAANYKSPAIDAYQAVDKGLNKNKRGSDFK